MPCAHEPIVAPKATTSASRFLLSNSWSNCRDLLGSLESWGSGFKEMAQYGGDIKHPMGDILERAHRGYPEN